MFKTINGWTKARMINAIKKGNNGDKAILGDICQYETRNGNHCAVGCFIPKRSRGMKVAGPVVILLRNLPHLKKKMPLELTAMIEFQRVHDGAGKRENVQEKLINWIKKNVVNGRVKK